MMSLQKLTLLVAVAFISLSVEATAKSKKYRDEEMGIWYTVPPKPAKVIRSQNLDKFLIERLSLPALGKKPKDWPVRALYTGPNGEFLEFDRDGRIVYDSENPDGRYDPDVYVMRQIFTRNKPVWKNAEVFHKIRELDENVPGYTAALVPHGMVRSRNGNVCPLRDIDPVAHQSPAPLGIHKYVLDGTCEEAIRIKINNHSFLTYPGFKKISVPYLYWSIQYFSDPVTPIYKESGECLRYCDEESQKNEAALRSAGNAH